METKEKVGVELDDIGFNTFLKYNPYLLTQRDYHLTELMEYKEDNSYSSFVMVSDYLKLYGIHVIGKTHMFDLNKNGLKNEVRAITLDKDFPIENAPLIEQLYGYENSLVFVALDRDENREYGFWFNLEDKSCELERLEYGNVKFSKKYGSFKEMFVDFKKNILVNESV